MKKTSGFIFTSIMLSVTIVFVLILLVGLLLGCSGIAGGTKGNGKITAKELTLDNFNSLAYSAVGDVNIRFSDSYSGTITTDSNIQELLEADVKDGVLIISFNKPNISPTKLVIDITMPEIKAIGMSGVGDITLSDGSASDLVVLHSGVGDIDAQNYQVKNAVISISGVGDVTVWATDSLSGKMSGVGDLLYKGNPSLNIDNSGVGNVEPL